MTSTTTNNTNNNNNATSINTNNIGNSNLKGTGGGLGPGAGGNNSSSSSSLIDSNTNNQNNSPTLVHRKVAILGWKNVGKSSLVNSFVNGTFVPTTTTTDPNNSKQMTTNINSASALSSSIIETTYTKTIRFRKVHFHTDIVDTAGMSTMTDEQHHYDNQHGSMAGGFCYSTYSSRLSRNASLGVHGYILVFSLLSRQSFEQVQRVNSSLLKTLGNAPDTSNSAPPRVLVGTMLDVAAADADADQQHPQPYYKSSSQQRQVSFAEAQALAMSWKSGQGVPYMECSSKTGEGVAEVFHTLLKEIEKDDGLLLGGSDETYYGYGGVASSCVLV